MDNPDTADPIVGHKTLIDGSHIPLYESEAREIMARVEADDARRKSLMPDERSAIHMLWDAHQRLKDMGWREAQYCPKDGSSFDVIECGSTGIHPCFYEGEWPSGYWMVGEGEWCGPSRPVLFKLRPEDQAKYDAKMAAARARFKKESENAHT